MLNENDQFINYYKCVECDNEWQMQYMHCCDDRCPECNVSIEPYRIEDIEKGR